MTVLSGREIRKRLQREVTDPKALCIAPLLREDQIGVDAVDVHLGNYFLRSRSERINVFRIGEPLDQLQELVHVPMGRELMLPAHGSVLGVVLEYVRLPHDVSAQILTRSSYARLFVSIATATWVHPAFRGCLTLEISNAADVAFALEPGTPIAQLVFYRVRAGAAMPPPSQFGGVTFPHFPRFERDAAWVGRFRAQRRGQKRKRR